MSVEDSQSQEMFGGKKGMIVAKVVGYFGSDKVGCVAEDGTLDILSTTLFESFPKVGQVFIIDDGEIGNAEKNDFEDRSDEVSLLREQIHDLQTKLDEASSAVQEAQKYEAKIKSDLNDLTLKLSDVIRNHEEPVSVAENFYSVPRISTNEYRRFDDVQAPLQKLSPEEAKETFGS